MKKSIVLSITLVFIVIMFVVACSTRYEAKPLPFRTPGSYSNVQEFGGAQIAARSYVNVDEAKDAFGFDVRGAGLLPVEVVFDNKGNHELEISASQTFLEDNDGNLWPILADRFAYERVTKYAQTHETFKEGAEKGLLGAAAGAIIGAAIGIVTGEDVAEALGKGAALGGAAGATIGGAQGYTSGDARRSVMKDFKEKSLQNKAIEPDGLSYGFIFFPGEATSTKQLRMKVHDKVTGESMLLFFAL